MQVMDAQSLVTVVRLYVDHYYFRPFYQRNWTKDVDHIQQMKPAK